MSTLRDRKTCIIHRLNSHYIMSICKIPDAAGEKTSSDGSINERIWCIFYAECPCIRSARFIRVIGYVSFFVI